MYRSPGLHLDFFSKDVFQTKPCMAFDTLMLTDAAIQQGANMKSARLGKLVNWLGIHPQYRHNDSIIGCHNAGNDAAYTMMALLMYAVRWEEIVPGKAEPELPVQRPHNRLEYQRQGRKDNKAVIHGKRAIRKARLFSNGLFSSGNDSLSFPSTPLSNGFRTWFAMMASWARRP
ncbi:hypothetical protein Q7P37_001910 [Cladosporium fusiforme]